MDSIATNFLLDGPSKFPLRDGIWDRIYRYSLGGIVFPILVTRLIDEVGFHWAVRACGSLVLLLLIIANLTVKAYHHPHARR